MLWVCIKTNSTQNNAIDHSTVGLTTHNANIIGLLTVSNKIVTKDLEVSGTVSGVHFDKLATTNEEIMGCLWLTRSLGLYLLLFFAPSVPSCHPLP